MFILFIFIYMSSTFTRQLKKLPIDTMSTLDQLDSHHQSRRPFLRLTESMQPKLQAHPQNDSLALIRLKCKAKRLKLKRESVSNLKDNLSISISSSAMDAQKSSDDEDSPITKKSQGVYLLESIYKSRPPTIFFRSPFSEQQNSDRLIKVSHEELQNALGYFIHGKPYQCIVNVLNYSGFKPSSKKNSSILIDIPANRIQLFARKINSFQRINHFSGCWYIGRKDWLYRCLIRLVKSHPAEYDFVPKTYLLQSQLQYFNTVREMSSKNSLWILKPADSACGRGIRLISKNSKLNVSKNYIVSQYIGNPHLINGYKYDLRLYVLVTCLDPLRIYLFKKGMARFATEKFTCSHKTLKKPFVHLTNFSVNKKSKKFSSGNFSFKWTLEQLFAHYQQIGVDENALMSKVKDLIVKTIIACQGKLLDFSFRSYQRRNNFFQIYGFDVLIDSNLKPWLMQVNVCPSLASSSEMDRVLKHDLIAHTYTLLGISLNSSKLKDQKRRCLKRQNFYSINQKNCIQKLVPEGWNILFEVAEQFQRRGDYERLFPQKHCLQKYSAFFQVKRANNILVWNWLNSGKDFLQQVFQRVN